MTAGVWFEVENLSHTIEVDRTVNMREQFVGFIRARLPADFGLETRWINFKQHQPTLTGVPYVGNAQDLA